MSFYPSTNCSPPSGRATNFSCQDKKCHFSPLVYNILFLFLANQESFRGIADRFGLQKGNAHKIFLNTCKLICRLQYKYIVWPEGQQLRKTVTDFNNLRGQGSFPNVVGCVDGTHIAINGPKNDNSFYNRKGYHSAILQVICDSKLKFLDIFFGWPGSVHDARVWQNSPIYGRLKNNLLPEEYHLLGDTAYPVDTFLMAPFKDNGHLTNRQKMFNQKLSSSRVMVEQAIGRLKQVFRRLKFLDAKICNLKYYVVAACILQNYLISHNIENEVENVFDDDSDNEDTREAEEVINYDYDGVHNDERRGKLKREQILLNL